MNSPQRSKHSWKHSRLHHSFYIRFFYTTRLLSWHLRSGMFDASLHWAKENRNSNVKRTSLLMEFLTWLVCYLAIKKGKWKKGNMSILFFFKKNLEEIFVGLLIPLFWNFYDVCPGLQSQGGSPHLRASSSLCYRFLRFTSGARPADFLAWAKLNKTLPDARYHASRWLLQYLLNGMLMFHSDMPALYTN